MLGRLEILVTFGIFILFGRQKGLLWLKLLILYKFFVSYYPPYTHMRIGPQNVDPKSCGSYRMSPSH